MIFGLIIAAALPATAVFQAIPGHSVPQGGQPQNALLQSELAIGGVPRTVDTRLTSAVTRQVFWQFGDGNSSYQVEPQHQYAEPGVYQVTRQIFVDGQLQDQASSQVDLISPAIQQLSVQDASSDNSALQRVLRAKLDSSQPLALQYRWQVLGQSFSGEQIQLNFPKDGEYEVQLSAFWQQHQVAQHRTKVVIGKAAPTEPVSQGGGGSVAWWSIAGVLVFALRRRHQYCRQ